MILPRERAISTNFRTINRIEPRSKITVVNDSNLDFTRNKNEKTINKSNGKKNSKFV